MSGGMNVLHTALNMTATSGPAGAVGYRLELEGGYTEYGLHSRRECWKIDHLQSRDRDRTWILNRRLGVL